MRKYIKRRLLVILRAHRIVPRESYISVQRSPVCKEMYDSCHPYASRCKTLPSVGKEMNPPYSLDAVIRTQGDIRPCRPYARKYIPLCNGRHHPYAIRSAPTAVLSRDAARPSRDSPNTSPRRFALGASNVCLVGENRRHSPSRHCRDARVYGLTTTAMHDTSTPAYPEQQPRRFLPR